jgi:transposase
VKTQSNCLGSNVQAEGQINRLKTLKHTMYGRAE